MTRNYLIDGKEVLVTWAPRQHPAVYEILIDGRPIPGSVEKTRLGEFLARDEHGAVIGTFLGLRRAVEQVVRAKLP